MQNNTKQEAVNLQPAFRSAEVIHESQLAKALHKQIHARVAPIISAKLLWLIFRHESLRDAYFTFTVGREKGGRIELAKFRELVADVLHRNLSPAEIQFSDNSFQDS